MIIIDPYRDRKPQRNFDAISPVDGRYFDEEATRLLSDRAYTAALLQVEVAAAYTLADFGICTPNVPARIAEMAQLVTSEMVYDAEFGENGTGHDINALVLCIRDYLPSDVRRWVHWGMTSYDIINSAQAWLYKRAIEELIRPRLMKLEKALMAKAWKYAATPQIGRTHGQHAIPITFGFALALYISRLGDCIIKLGERSAELCGKIAGATGSYNATSLLLPDPYAYEKAVLAQLGLLPADISSQTVPKEPLIRLMQEIGLTGGVLANLGRDMRNLMRSEIAEVREKKTAKQVGSSTMPHKAVDGNPIVSENAEGFGRGVLPAFTLLSMLIQISEHQRDLTDSGAARFLMMVPAVLAYPAKRMGRVMTNLEVNEASLERNLKLKGSLIASEAANVLLAASGHPEAHSAVSLASVVSAREGISLVQALERDEETQRIILEGIMSHEVRDLLYALLDDPTKYSGRAEEKARMVTENWEGRLGIQHDEILAIASEEAA